MYIGTLSNRARRRGVRASRLPLQRKLTGRMARFPRAEGEWSSLLVQGPSAAVASPAPERKATTAHEAEARASSDCCSAALHVRNAST